MYERDKEDDEDDEDDDDDDDGGVDNSVIYIYIYAVCLYSNFAIF